MLRTLLGTGMTAQQYNDMTDEAYQAAVDESVKRAKLNINAPVSALDSYQIAAAANIGGNYFEHGYVALMAGIQAADKIQFTRIGGL